MKKYKFHPKLWRRAFAKMIQKRKVSWLPYVGAAAVLQPPLTAPALCPMLQQLRCRLEFRKARRDGLRGICTRVTSANVRPAIWCSFQGTYDTTGASHVGIYVGNGMYPLRRSIQNAVSIQLLAGTFLIIRRLPSP
jgi:hypothetical protein